MKTVIMPIPVDADIADLINRSAEITGLKKADVMRQGLRLGVPAVVQRLTAPIVPRRPQCLDFLDDYPMSTVNAKDVEKALKEKMARKYGGRNR
jgi:hypothetical protein